MEAQLAVLFKCIGEGEQEIEYARQTLFEAIGGNTEVAFKRLDKFDRNAISVHEVAEFLKTFNIYPEQEELKFIIDYYDQEGNGTLTLKSFTKAITPSINKYIKPPTTKNTEKEIDNLITEFWITELDFLRDVLLIRKPMLEDNKNTVYDFFRLIDTEGKGSFTPQELDKFLEKNGYVLHNQELIAILRRADKEEKQRITYKDFQEHILPDLIQEKKIFESVFSPDKNQKYSNETDLKEKKQQPNEYNSPYLSVGSTNISFGSPIQNSGYRPRSAYSHNFYRSSYQYTSPKTITETPTKSTYSYISPSKYLSNEKTK